MYKLVIDLGTAITKICKLKTQEIITEDTCIACDKSGTIIACGKDARTLIDNNTPNTVITFPVFEGEIVNVTQCSKMLKSFLSKANIKPSLLGLDTVFCVSVGLSEEQRAKYYELANLCHLGKIALVESPFISALGQEVDISGGGAKCLVDIGSGRTNLSILNNDKMVAGFSFNVGGTNIDSHILDLLSNEYDLKSTIIQTETIKRNLASLSNEITAMSFSGYDNTKKTKRTINISSKDLVEVLEIYLDKIIEYIEDFRTRVPDTIAKCIWENGLYLSGGTALTKGIKEYFEDKTSLPIHIISSPQYATLLGGKKLLENQDLIELYKVKD